MEPWSGGTPAFFNAAIDAVLVLYLVRTLGLSAATIRTIFSVWGVGFLVGAVLARRITRYVPLGVDQSNTEPSSKSWNVMLHRAA
jgi:hypothetical protein